MRIFVLAFVLGTLWLQQAAELPRIALLPAGVAFLLALPLVPARFRGARIACVALAGGLAGVSAAAWWAQAAMASALPRAWEGEDIEVVGVVAGLPQLTEGGTRFAFDVESVRTPRAIVPPTVALTWYTQRAKGDGDAIPPPPIASGQRWRIVVRLKRPRGLA
ncbi:MAG TPA: ComEC/Rec2 family competence protein, partial [Usitatibacter sp.]